MEIRVWLRSSYRKIVIVQVVVVLALLVAMYRRTNGDAAHTMLALAMVFATIFLLFSTRREPLDPRPLDASSSPIDTKVHELLQGAPEDLRGASDQDLSPTQEPAQGSGLTNPESLVPEGAKRVYDLKDLPPEVAADPEVQKLLQMAGARAWVKVTRRDKSANSGFAGDAESGPETTKISVSIKRSGHPMQMGTTEETSELPPELDSSDPEQLARWVKSQEMRSSDARGATPPAKAFLRLIVVFTAIAVAVVGLWMLYFNN